MPYATFCSKVHYTRAYFCRERNEPNLGRVWITSKGTVSLGKLKRLRKQSWSAHGYLMDMGIHDAINHEPKIKFCNSEMLTHPMDGTSSEEKKRTK